MKSRQNDFTSKYLKELVEFEISLVGYKHLITAFKTGTRHKFCFRFLEPPRNWPRQFSPQHRALFVLFSLNFDQFALWHFPFIFFSLHIFIPVLAVSKQFVQNQQFRELFFWWIYVFLFCSIYDCCFTNWSSISWWAIFTVGWSVFASDSWIFPS